MADTAKASDLVEMKCQICKGQYGLIPATKFLDNTPRQQMYHVLSEVNEADNALWLFCRNDYGKEHLAEELVDLQMSCETMLAILGLDEKQRDAVRARVIEKNRARGYYNEP